MTYLSTTTGQIRQAIAPSADSTLKIHDLVVGLPLCGQLVLPWHGDEMVLIETGEREVTCGRCARSHATQAA